MADKSIWHLGERLIIPKTGQVTSIRTGDDGDIQAGRIAPATRWRDNGDDTVTDMLTGLMWPNGYWAVNGGDALSWADAIDACNSLDWAGYTDWRMPNINELLSPISHDNPDLWPALIGVDSINFWSSTTLWEGAYAYIAQVYGAMIVQPWGVTELINSFAVRGGI